MTRIVHLTSVHRSDDIRIYQKQCRTLAEAGHDIALLVMNQTTERGRDVPVINAGTTGNRLTRMIFSNIHLTVRALKEHCSVVHFHDPELIPCGLILRLLGKAVIYDVHEDCPKSIMDKIWITPALRWPVAKCVSFLEWLGGKAFSAIVTATPAIARRFPASKTSVVQNFPFVDEFVGASLKGDDDKDRGLVCFVGGITEGRGAKQMVQAVELLADLPEVLLHLAGPIRPPSLLFELEVLDGWQRVVHDEWLTRDQIDALFSRCTAGLVLFLPERNHIEAQPNKMFEYMSAGLPVIASDFPLWRAIVEDSECGLLADPASPEAIADAIRWIMENPDAALAMGHRGRNAVLERYNWETESQTLLSLYERIGR